MLVGVTRLLKGIDLIDHWMNLMLVEEVIHAFEGAVRSDSDPPDGGLPTAGFLPSQHRWFGERTRVFTGGIVLVGQGYWTRRDAEKSTLSFPRGNAELLVRSRQFLAGSRRAEGSQMSDWSLSSPSVLLTMN